MDNNLQKIDEFLEIYSEIGQKKLLEKDISSDLKNLKEKIKELDELKLLSVSDFDFESDEKFLKSVNEYVNNLLKTT